MLCQHLVFHVGSWSICKFSQCNNTKRCCAMQLGTRANSRFAYCYCVLFYVSFQEQESNYHLPQCSFDFAWVEDLLAQMLVTTTNIQPLMSFDLHLYNVLMRCDDAFTCISNQVWRYRYTAYTQKSDCVAWNLYMFRFSVQGNVGLSHTTRDFILHESLP